MRIVIGEDQALLREGLVLLLERRGFEVAGVARRRRGPRSQGARPRPRLVVADVRMPPSQTDEGLRRRAHDPREPSAHRARRAVAARPGRYATELVESSETPRASATCSSSAWRTATRSARTCAASRRGGSVLDPEVVRSMITRHAQRAPSPTSPLVSATCSASWPRGAATPGSPSSSCCPRRPYQARLPHLRVLGLRRDANDHRRVLAVVRYLNA